MLLLTLSKKINQNFGPFLLKHGIRARFVLGAGGGGGGDGVGDGPIMKDNPALDAILLLPWSMRIISLEVHEESKQKIQQEQASTAIKTATNSDIRVQVLERYARRALIPNERWSDVVPWMFHIRLLKWIRSELLWAKFGEHVQTAFLAFPSLKHSPQLMSSQEIKQQPLPSCTSSLPTTNLLRDALDLHDWTNNKNWAATGLGMKRLAKALLGNVVEYGSMTRFTTNLDPNTDLSQQSLFDVMELAGAYVHQHGPLNALCEKLNIYQIWTREYVEKLGHYLMKRTQSYEGGSTIILDVGAGDGILAHYLRELVIQEERDARVGTNSCRSNNSNHRGGGKCDKNRRRRRRRHSNNQVSTPPPSPSYKGSSTLKVPTIIATDDGSWRISQIAPVEVLSVKETLETYANNNGEGGNDDGTQVIVLCSWMPMNEDWSRLFRKANVDEYVLIGEIDNGQCGDNWETWGNPEYYSSTNCEPELATVASLSDNNNNNNNNTKENDANNEEIAVVVAIDNKQEQQVEGDVPRPSYEVDGYQRKELDALAKYQFSRFDCQVSKVGRTVSFRKID